MNQHYPVGRDALSLGDRLAQATLIDGRTQRVVGIAAMTRGGVLTLLPPGSVHTELRPPQDWEVLRGLPDGYRLATPEDIRQWRETVADGRVSISPDDTLDVTAPRRRRSA